MTISLSSQAKGEFVGAGTTSLVELLPSGYVIKSPLTGDLRAEDCRKEITIEAQVYQRLNGHPRLVKMKHWDPKECTLTLEYMPNGTLEDYITSAPEVSWSQKRQWILEATEAVDFLHSSGVIHCDIAPRNLLLDGNLSLKIIDFSGSSLDGARAMVCPGVRYRAPNEVKLGRPPTVKEDFFALGSTIYYIVPGETPFQDLPDDRVKESFLSGIFPDLGGNPCQKLIESCWKLEFASTQEILEMVPAL